MNIKIKVPATSANLGPGFDTLGLALDLWNETEFVADIETDSELEADVVNGLLRKTDARMDSTDERIVEDRQAAIRAALNGMGTDDCVLVAGKGHENYQIIGATRRHFSDQEEIAAWSNAGKGAVRREAGTWN